MLSVEDFAEQSKEKMREAMTRIQEKHQKALLAEQNKAKVYEAMVKIQKGYQKIFDEKGIKATILVHGKENNGKQMFQISAKDKGELERAEKILMDSPKIKELGNIFTEKSNIVQSAQKLSPSRHPIAAERER
jgi:hypothetical protein